MLSFLFWNIARRPIARQIAQMARRFGIDVLMLAESAIDPEVLIGELNGGGGVPFAFQPSDGEKIQFYSLPAVGQVIEQFVDGPGNMTIRRLNLPANVAVLVAVVHLPGKVNWSATAQAMHSGEISRDIRLVEQDVGHTRTIVVGDLNMHPFDAGVVGAHGLNAVLTRREARIRPRTVQGRQYPYFFNPMWQFFGDHTPAPSGTYYHRSPPPDAQAWSVYDQILLRPSVMDLLESVEILSTDGVDSLVNPYGVPARHRGSDHLPILFRMRL